MKVGTVRTLHKPASVAKAEQRVIEARRDRQAAEAAHRSRIARLLSEGKRNESDAYLEELDRRMQAAAARVGEARREREAALRKWAPEAQEAAQGAVDEVRERIDHLLSELEQLTAPIARFADECVSAGLAEPMPAQKARELWQLAHAGRRRLADAIRPRLIEVRFLRDHVVNDHRKGTSSEERYASGKVYALPESSAVRYVNRGWAVLADVPYTPPAMVRIKFRDRRVAPAFEPGEPATVYQPEQIVELAEPAARMWIEKGAADPVDSAMWGKLWDGLRAAATSPSPITSPQLEAPGVAVSDDYEMAARDPFAAPRARARPT